MVRPRETTVTGGLACTGDNSTAVRNGLLPAAFVFSVSTRQDNIDISATIGLYPGINSSAAAGVNGAGLPAALQTPGIDARQEFLTFGDASWGTVKLGRDIGLFGKDAILDDMTLLGVGTAPAAMPRRATRASAASDSATSIPTGNRRSPTPRRASWDSPDPSAHFSRWITEITPRMPRPSGRRDLRMRSATRRAIRSPARSGSTSSLSSQRRPLTAQRVPDFCVPVNNALGIRNDVHGTAVDGGVKIDFAGFEAVAYGYYGKGVGTTGLYILAVSATGQERESNGGYVQLTYKIDRLKIGASYGISQLKLASDEQAYGIATRASPACPRATS